MILYLMIHFPFVWWIKIGFAHTSAIKRAAALDKAVFGFFVPVGIVAIPFAYAVEQWFHRRFKWLQIRWYRATAARKRFGYRQAYPFWRLWFWFGGCYFWAAGAMCGFDGLDWYCDFLRGIFETLKEAAGWLWNILKRI